jgi:hypothetical protein
VLGIHAAQEHNYLISLSVVVMEISQDLYLCGYHLAHEYLNIRIAADWEHQSHNKSDYTKRLYLIIESLDVYSLHYTHLGTTHQTHNLR